MSRKKPKNAPPLPSPSVPPSWLAAGVAAWACVVLARGLGGTRWLPNLERWLSLAWAVAPGAAAAAAEAKRVAFVVFLTAALTGTGRLLMKRIAVETDDLWEELSLGFGLGYGAWGTVLLLLGLAGCWRKPILLGLLAAGFLIGLTGLRGLKRSPGAAAPDGFSFFAGLSILALWLSLLRYALVPETFYDALHYHLALPNLYLLNGRILPLPEHSFSGVPSLPEMINGLILAADSWGISASVLHCSLVLWIGAQFLALSRRLVRPAAGPLAAAAFFVGTPVVLGESFRLSVGLEWTFMQLCCFTCFFAALSAAPGTRERRGRLLLGGSFLGFALATKYPAWIVPLAFLPALAAAGKNDEGLVRFGARELALFLGVAALWIAPWIVKNFFFYGNPVFPFFHQRLFPSAEHLPDQIQTVFSGAAPAAGAREWIKAWFYQPWRLLSPGDFAESIGPFVPAFLPLVFLVRLSKREKILAWLCLGTWVPLSLITAESRFLIPHLASMTLLASCVLAGFEPKRLRGFLMGLAAVLWSATGLTWIAVDAHRAKLDVFLGRESYGDFLRRAVVSYPTPAYPGIEFVNAHAPPDAVVLFYGDARSFYIKRRAIVSSSDQVAVLETWANESSDAESLKKRFRERGVGYILANLGEMSRRGDLSRLTPQGRAALFSFWRRYTLQVYNDLQPHDHWVRVYRVLDDAEAAKPHPVDDLFFPASGSRAP